MNANGHQPDHDDEIIDGLINQLTESEADFAATYLRMREKESLPGKFLSVDDARANAVLDLVKRKVPLPEVVRWQLHGMFGIVRAVESS